MMRLRVFFRRHRHLLPVLGAGVVLATFVVREVLRDRVKDIVDDIKRANDLAFLTKQFQAVAKRSDLLGKEQAGDEVAPYLIRIEKFSVWIDEMESQRRAAEYLAAAAGLDLQQITLAKDFDARCEKARATLTQLHGDVLSYYYPRNPRDLDAPQKQLFDKTLDEIGGGLAFLDSFIIQSDSKAVFRAAESKQAAAEHAYELYSKLSYWVLFPLGWALGLVGKFLGQETSAE